MSEFSLQDTKQSDAVEQTGSDFFNMPKWHSFNIKTAVLTLVNRLIPPNRRVCGDGTTFEQEGTNRL
jgi:hypothetical protein